MTLGFECPLGRTAPSISSIVIGARAYRMAGPLCAVLVGLALIALQPAPPVPEGPSHHGNPSDLADRRLAITSSAIRARMLNSFSARRLYRMALDYLRVADPATEIVTLADR